MSQLSFVDTHAHLAAADFSEDLADTLSRAEAAHVRRYVVIGSGDQFVGNEKALHLAQTHESIHATIGFHPHDASLCNEESLAKLSSMFQQSKKIVGWGEIGLDYHYMHADKETQQRAFVAQIHLAYDLNLPIIIHTREAEADTVSFLTKYRKKIHGVVVHCFTGGPDFAQSLLGLDATLGIGGVLTFKSADSIRQAVTAYPLEKLLLETDCPYLAPVPHRGKRNEPAFIPLIAKRLAELKNIELQEIAEQTTLNAQNFFRLP